MSWSHQKPSKNGYVVNNHSKRFKKQTMLYNYVYLYSIWTFKIVLVTSYYKKSSSWVVYCTLLVVALQAANITYHMAYFADILSY